MCVIKPRFQKAHTGFSVKGGLKAEHAKREVEKATVTDQEGRRRIELYINALRAQRSGCNEGNLADRSS